MDGPSASTAPEGRLVSQQLPAPAGVRLFEPPPPAGGCASGECEPSEEPDTEDEAAALAPQPVVREGDRWRKAVEAVRNENARLGNALSHARFLGLTPDGVRVAFPAEAGFHRSTVFGQNRPVVEQALARALGRAARLVEETSAAALSAAPRSLAEEETSARTGRERNIEARVREHPAVRAIARVLGGTVEHIQVLEAPPPEPVEVVAPAVGDDEP